MGKEGRSTRRTDALTDTQTCARGGGTNTHQVPNTPVLGGVQRGLVRVGQVHVRARGFLAALQVLDHAHLVDGTVYEYHVLAVRHQAAAAQGTGGAGAGNACEDMHAYGSGRKRHRGSKLIAHHGGGRGGATGKAALLSRKCPSSQRDIHGKGNGGRRAHTRPTGGTCLAGATLLQPRSLMDAAFAMASLQPVMFHSFTAIPDLHP